jgi:type IV secretion system protein VirD4
MKKILLKIIFASVISLLMFHLTIGILYIEYIYNPKLILIYIKEMEDINNWELLIQLGACVSLIIFVLIVFSRRKKQVQYGFSRYGDFRDRKKAELNSKEGICLGSLVIPNPTDTLNIKKFKITNKSLKANKPLSIGVLAPPGTGKTTAVIIPTLLHSKNTFIINDPKGELFEKTAGVRSRHSKILRFDPMQVHGKGIVFNPFSENMIPTQENKIFNYINQIANILILNSEKGGDDYFIQNARTVFTFVACYLIKFNKSTSFSEIASKILEDSNIVITFENMIQELENAEEVNHFVRAIIKQGNSALSSASAPEAWGSIISTLVPLIQNYATDDLIQQATTGDNEIDLKQFREGSYSLYIIVPDSSRKVLYPLVRILLELSASKLISISEESQAGDLKNNKRITFLIDEFPRLGKLKELLELPAISRGMGVNVVFVAQSIQQIEKTYSREEAKGMFSLLAYWYVFKQGDIDTAEMFSKQIGKHTVSKTSLSYTTRSIIGEKKSSRSLSQEGLPLVSANEIMATDEKFGWLISSHNPTRPFRVKHEFWFKNKKLKKLVNKYENMIDIICDKEE